MVDEWTQERGKVPGVESSTGGFSNGCKSMRFRTAALTLDSMIRKLGASSAQVKEWVQAQDKAFDDCSSSTSGSPAPTPPADIPPPLTDGTPFERAQRNYQIAAATFYSGDFDAAGKMFEAIAADPSSPWHELASYLAVRAMIGKATSSAATNDHAILAQAEARLN